MRYILCFLLFCSSLSAAGPLENPSILYTRVIDTEQGTKDVGYDVLPLADGTAIVSGSSTNKSGTIDGLLMHVNARGDVLWRKTFGGAGLDLIFSAHQDGDGFLCVGFKAPSGATGMKAMDGWILRIDASGNLVWEHTYGGPGEDRLTGMRKTKDGWIAVGHRESDGRIQAWILRIDSQGKELESWTDSSDVATKGLDVLPLEDGGFVVAGGVGNERETSDGFVMRVDGKRNKVWNQVIGGNGFQVGYHLQPYSDGSYLVIGYGAAENRKDHQAYVQHLTPEGKVLFYKTFGGPTHDRATNALILENNKLVVAGQTQRDGAADEDSGWDMIIYTLDQEGNPTWSGRHGGEGVEFGRAVKGNAEQLWIIGHTTSAQPETSNVLIVRMDASNVMK